MEFPISDNLVKEFAKVLEQYNEGAIHSVEAVAKIYHICAENQTTLYHEYEAFSKQLDEANKVWDKTRCTCEPGKLGHNPACPTHGISAQLDRTQME